MDEWMDPDTIRMAGEMVTAYWVEIVGAAATVAAAVAAFWTELKAALAKLRKTFSRNGADR